MLWKHKNKTNLDTTEDIHNNDIDDNDKDIKNHNINKTETNNKQHNNGKQDVKNNSILKIIKTFYKTYCLKYLSLFIIILILNIIVAGVSSLVAYLIGPFVNKVLLSKNSSLLFGFCVGLLVLFVLKSVCVYISSLLTNSVSLRIINSIRLDIFKKLIQMSMKDLNALEKGQFITLVQNDVSTIDFFFSYVLLNLVKNIVLCVSLTGMVLYTNWFMAVVILIVYPLIVMPLKKISKKLRDKTFIVQESNQYLTSKIVDAQTGIKTIKTFNSAQMEITYFVKTIRKLINNSLSAVRTSALMSPVNEMMSGIVIIIVMALGGYQVSKGMIDVGGLVSFLAALLMVVHPIKATINSLAIIQTAVVSMTRVRKFLLNTKKEHIFDGIKVDLTAPLIEMKNVDFNYNNQQIDNNNDIEPQQTTLKDINLVIKPYSKVAFVGASGCGKTTIINLLLRLYDYQSGEITINGVDIKDVSVASLRKNIAYVGQDNFLFDSTIKKNIIYNTPKTQFDADKLDKVIKLAQAEFIYDLEEGVNTEVGLQGSYLSGGQKQRIAIARALLKDAPIIIFDEATSALDANTESKIREVIFKEMQNKTIIMIAHRLSTIIDCDMIFCMHEGKIVEQGTHNELLKKNGFYSRLWNNFQNNNN